MSFAGTIYTIAAAGVFAFMITRPPVEMISAEPKPTPALESSANSAADVKATESSASSTNTIAPSSPPKATDPAAGEKPAETSPSAQ